MQSYGTPLTGDIWHIRSSQRLYEAHPNLMILLLLRPSQATINKNRSVGTKGKGYRIDIDRAEAVAGTKLPSAQKEKGAARLYKVRLPLRRSAVC